MTRITALHDSPDTSTRVRAFRLEHPSDRRQWVVVTEACGHTTIAGPGAPRGGVTAAATIDRVWHWGGEQLCRCFLDGGHSADRGKLLDRWEDFKHQWVAPGGPGWE